MGRQPADEDLWIVEDVRRRHLPTLGAVQQRLSTFFHDEAGIPEETIPVTSRLKTPHAIVAKLRRSSTALSRMQDIAGARIVVPSLGIQDITTNAVTRSVFRDEHVDTKDQRVEPDQWGYRAIHVIVSADDCLAEIQIRTIWQDRWAQSVESVDSTLATDLKHGRGSAEWLEWLHELSDQFRKADLGEPFMMPTQPFDQDVTE